MTSAEAIPPAPLPHGAVVLLNGAFGIGKTTVARILRTLLPRAIIVNPEHIGFVLQRLPGGWVDDFQDLKLWRRLTIALVGAVCAAGRTVVVPMAISNPAYLAEIREGLTRRGHAVTHVCLVAPPDVVLARMAERGHSNDAWARRRALECCAAHSAPEFALHLNAADQPAASVAAAVVRTLRGGLTS